ncbi:hypothetical protein LDENG_00097160 [Lucifuga dentata]|nr:hypothetical protein LDENG_00097160 [Lucifuga dentata]
MLKQDQRTALEQPIQLQEIEESIRLMQTRKTPGSDGFPVEFYKTFFSKIAPLILSMFEYSFKQSTLPQTLTEVIIIVLLKPGKDPLDCNSYRPISLLNVDVKILSKLLASANQTGFIKGRHSFTNIQELLNVVCSSVSGDVAEVVISLDAEKAFDRVEWSYLFAVLDRFGFGPKIISWIRLLYSSPKAAVLTNKLHSQYFALTRGTRQGRP